MIIIRDATERDAEVLRQLNERELGYAYPLKDTRKNLKSLLLNEDHRIFVAEEEGKVIGYVHACHYESLYFPSMKNIMGIAVDHEHRRKHVGTMLLEAVEEWAVSDGCDGVRLVSGIQRTQAHEFYRHCGYEGNKKQLNMRKKL